MVSFLMRSHDMTLGTAATVMGVVIGGIGIVSTLAVGPIVDRARRRFPRIRTWLPAAGMAWCGTFYALAFTTPQTALAVAFLITAQMGPHFSIPALYTLARGVSPPPLPAPAP